MICEKIRNTKNGCVPPSDHYPTDSPAELRRAGNFFFKAPFGKREEWQFSHFYATFASNEIFQN